MLPAEVTVGRVTQALPVAFGGGSGLGSRAPEDRLSPWNSYFDFILYVASSLLSFVYLDSLT